MTPRLPRPLALVVLLTLLATLTPAVAAAQVGGLTITTPQQGSAVTAGPVEVRGAFALSASEQVNVVYAVDVSSSTEQPTAQDCNGDGASDVLDDFNGDGATGTTLDCEISGIVALNASLAGRAGVHVALVGFAGSARSAATYAGSLGLQDATFITPPEADTPDTVGSVGGVGGVGGVDVEPDGGVPDLVNIATSLDTHRIGLFSPRSLSSGTRFDPALAAVDSVLDVPRTRTFVFVVSDGDGTLTDAPGAPLDALAQRGAVVSTFSVGGDGAGCGAASPLRVIADRTGGACREQVDPAGLSAVLGDLAPPALDRVEVDLGDGSGPQRADVDPLGNWSFTYPDLRPGAYQLTATAHLRDGTTAIAGPSGFTVVSERLQYVALGDSYSSGEGLEPFEFGPEGGVCHRSQTQAYPFDVMVGGVTPPRRRGPRSASRPAPARGCATCCPAPSTAAATARNSPPSVRRPTSSR